MICSPNKHFFSFSNKQTLDKNRKIFRPTDPNIFPHVSGNTGNFFRPKVKHVLKFLYKFSQTRNPANLFYFFTTKEYIDPCILCVY